MLILFAFILFLSLEFCCYIRLRCDTVQQSRSNDGLLVHIDYIKAEPFLIQQTAFCLFPCNLPRLLHCSRGHYRWWWWWLLRDDGPVEMTFRLRPASLEWSVQLGLYEHCLLKPFPVPRFTRTEPEGIVQRHRRGQPIRSYLFLRTISATSVGVRCAGRALPIFLPIIFASDYLAFPAHTGRGTRTVLLHLLRPAVAADIVVRKWQGHRLVRLRLGPRLLGGR
uniref:Putative secreted protein n=1 Tax=Anopheles marajoara TaxID=58244 RepID=A0A2M4C5P6_9DIPT